MNFSENTDKNIPVISSSLALVALRDRMTVNSGVTVVIDLGMFKQDAAGAAKLLRAKLGQKDINAISPNDLKFANLTKDGTKIVVHFGDVNLDVIDGLKNRALKGGEAKGPYATFEISKKLAKILKYEDVKAMSDGFSALFDRADWNFSTPSYGLEAKKVVAGIDESEQKYAYNNDLIAAGTDSDGLAAFINTKGEIMRGLDPEMAFNIITGELAFDGEHVDGIDHKCMILRAFDGEKSPELDGLNICRIEDDLVYQGVLGTDKKAFEPQQMAGQGDTNVVVVPAYGGTATYHMVDAKYGIAAYGNDQALETVVPGPFIAALTQYGFGIQDGNAHKAPASNK